MTFREYLIESTNTKIVRTLLKSNGIKFGSVSDGEDGWIEVYFWDNKGDEKYVVQIGTLVRKNIISDYDASAWKKEAKVLIKI